jgi:hypothetical protein
VVEEVNRTRQDRTHLWRQTGSSRSWTCSTAWMPSPAGRCLTWPTPGSAPPAGGDTQTTLSFIPRGLSTWRWPGGHAGSVKLDNRVSFPLSGLDLTPYLLGPLQCSRAGSCLTCMWLCVTMGLCQGVNTQHMPSIARLISGTISMTHRVPVLENQDDDYVLFYKRRRRATLLLQCAAVPFAA